MRRNTSRKQSTTQKQFTIRNSFCRRRRGIGACSTVLVDFSAVARHFGLPALTQYDVASAQAFCHCSATCVQNCMGLIAAVCKASAFAPAAPYRPVSTLSSTRTRGLSLRGDGAGDDASDGALEACFYSCRIIVRSLRHLHERLRHSRQLVRTGALCRNASSSICLTRKSATSAREMNPHVQSRGSTNAR